MKNTILLLAGLAMPTIAFAATNDPLNGADFVVNCVSDSNGGAVTLARSGATDKGFIVTDDIKGEATIIAGLNSLTFLHIMDKDVVTFVVDFDNLNYDMSIKGPHAAQDFGSCGDPIG
ncbi:MULTISPECIES: hypothetical protein [Alphaproteobacteria]|uniref:hypothetical protein n=1 Tax=Alphaproteobacteria TaxID=28211 RepID=UPI0012BC4828|nr:MULTISPECIES: hypothetical protein [Alphaproteobacteria]MTH99193.1 hypothetical protein [Roseibium sp. RKSG952]